jgi:hypothetical protein
MIVTESIAKKVDELSLGDGEGDGVDDVVGQSEAT